MTSLDADGHEIAAPEQAAMAGLPAEARAKMAEAMKARGLSMPDASGASKVPHQGDVRIRHVAADGVERGLHDHLSTQTSTNWKFHSGCMRRSSPSRMARWCSPTRRTTGPKVTTTSTMSGKTRTTTRVVQAKWLGADCGDIKPFTPPPRK
jgi:hypothetical protein